MARGSLDLDAGEVPGAAPPMPPSPRKPGRVCAILTADCLPVLFAADSGDGGGRRPCGLARPRRRSHRGDGAGARHAPRHRCWRGWVPAIGPRHFEIGAEVRDALAAQPIRGRRRAFEPNARGRFMADLDALARRRLARLGIERIYGGGECTYARAG